MKQKGVSQKLKHYRKVFANAVKHAKGKKGAEFKKAVKHYISVHHKKH